MSHVTSRALGRVLRLGLWLGAGLFAGGEAWRSGVAGEGAKTAPPAPTEFAFVYSTGYGTVDHAYKTEAQFEKFIVGLKSAGFNAVHTQYKDWRVPICRKHGVKMMIDVLAWKEGAETDIRKDDQRATVKAICEKVRGDPGVWGYNLWNERMDFYGSFEKLNEHLALLRKWDPTHPVWVGTYRNYFPERLQTNPGIYGYYDYHWRRGMHWHFQHLTWYRKFVESREAYFGRWLYMHDYRRNKYTLHTSIPFGLKVAMWFIGGPWDRKRHRLIEDHHLVKIGREVRTMYGELMKIGRPVAVYSAPTARTPANQDKKPGIPRPLEPFPADHWLQVKQGEAVVGFFKYPGGGDAVYFANHNAFAWQGMVVALKQSKGLVGAWQFDRRVGHWARFEPGELFSFPLAPGDGELFKFQRRRE